MNKDSVPSTHHNVASGGSNLVLSLINSLDNVVQLEYCSLLWPVRYSHIARSRRTIKTSGSLNLRKPGDPQQQVEKEKADT